MNTADILAFAAEYIKSNGLCKGQGIDGKRVCTWAAITLAEGPQVSRLDSEQAVGALQKFLNLPNPASAIFEWNDNLSRTEDQVVSALLGAALMWRAEHEQSQTAGAAEAQPKQEPSAIRELEPA